MGLGVQGAVVMVFHRHLGQRFAREPIGVHVARRSQGKEARRGRAIVVVRVNAFTSEATPWPILIFFYTEDQGGIVHTRGYSQHGVAESIGASSAKVLDPRDGLVVQAQRVAE